MSVKLIVLGALFASSILDANSAGFDLIIDGAGADIYYAGSDKIVGTGVDIFCCDIAKVTHKGSVRVEQPKSTGIISIFVLDNISVQSKLEEQGVQVESIVGKWEAFRIQESKGNLYVVGSDARGAIYGLMELSRMIGISPWEWWADVTPNKIGNFAIPRGFVKQDMPAVQYRGIFINDEDWSFVPWSAGFEGKSRTGSIGPKTYSKVFELLLRLRANTIWPAMHEGTKPFYLVEGNREIAAKYGIVVGTSHCEPLMRNNAGEWSIDGEGDYNFTTNNEQVEEYWKHRLD